MKNTTKQATRQPTRKTIKATINRITALFLALLLTIITLSSTITTMAADTTETDSNRDSGGHQVGDRPSGVADFYADIKEVLPVGANAYAYSFFSFEEYNKPYVNYFGFACSGLGAFRFRTVDYVHESGSDTETHYFYMIILSDKPFELRVGRQVRISGEKQEATLTDIINVGTVSKFSDKSFYVYRIFLGYCRAKNATQISYIPHFVKISSSNLMEIPAKNGVPLDSYDWIVEKTLDIKEAEDGNYGFTDGTSDGTGDGTSDGTGDGTSNGTGDGTGDNSPDFDIDFSNIFTLISSIVKVLIEFVTFLLTLLLETLTTLLNEVGQFSSLLGAIFTFLPESIFSVLLSGIVIIVFVGIFRK